MRVALALCVALAACGGDLQTARSEITFDLGARRATYRVEIADEPSERATGLMNRTALAGGAGMLFVWDDVDERDFHMLNTLIPLDLVSIRAGRVVGVQHMVPCEVTTDCPTTTTPPADAALEINAGEARRAGIAPGALAQSSVLT